MEKYNNTWFIEQLKQSFRKYLESGSSRSTEKLKPLHSAFGEAIKDELKDEEGITIKSQGMGDNREGTIVGKYSKKRVDITVFKDENPIAGLAVKFVMRNFSQNVVNYFDNMLGETVNIRSKNIPYFQILVLFDKIPYFKNGGNIDHWEDFTNKKKDKFSKYEILSNDDPNKLLHTPSKMLIVLLHLEDNEITTEENNKKITTSDMDKINNFSEYKDYFLPKLSDKDILKFSKHINYEDFNNCVILNNFEDFIRRVGYTIKATLKKS